jgi:outer membrane protein assembly factor BamA
LKRLLPYLFILNLFFILKTKAQNKIEFDLSVKDNPSFIKKIKTKNSYSSRSDVEKEINSIISQLRTEGYLLATIDTIKFDSLHCKAVLQIGDKYKWAQLKKGNVDADILSSTGFHEKIYANTTFKPAQFSKVFEKILSWCDNNGYPFARIKLDSVVIEGSSISAQLHLTKNRAIKIDTFSVEGNALIKKNFLYHYLHIKQGDVYDEHYIKQISQRIKQLPFLREKQSQVVKITDNYTKLILFLDKKTASQFDGILGLQPQNNGKTVLTGDMRIRLYNNVFRAGELFDLNWKRLQYQTQDLKVAVSYPYLLRLPIGADYSLSLYKRDTTFIDVQNNVGLQYLFSGLNNIKVFYKQRNTNLLSTASLTGLTTLPSYADIATYAYGIGFLFEKLNYKFNPRSGVSVNVSGSAGNRDIQKNSKLDENLYKDIQLKSTQYQGDGNIAFYIPLLKFSTIKLGAQGGSLMSPQLFKNELYRIGGFKTLRGFDEQSIFASSYAIGTFEYRFLFEQNSAFILFADGCWYENNSVGGKYVTDTPYSVGAGVSFETKAGIFQLNYAIGSQFGNPFDFRTGKINFGLVNTF